MSKIYKKQILSDLLEHYEASEVFRSGIQNRRVFLSNACFARLNEAMESPDEKKEILDTLEELSARGLLDYSWVKHEKGNLVDRIWLNTDPAAIEESYRISGKSNVRKQLDLLLEQLSEAVRELTPDTFRELISETVNEMSPDTVRELIPETVNELSPDTVIERVSAAGNLPEIQISSFLLDQANRIKEKHKIPRYFSGSKYEDDCLIRCLLFIGKNEGEISERILSSRLYGDSKVFERQIRSRVLSCLRAIEKENDQEKLQDDELLQKYGIVRWPEIMEFCGNLFCLLDDGSSIDYSTSIYGAYMNSDTVMHLQELRMAGIRRVLFIENKANYVWYVREKIQPDELVIFHGGFFSPAKGRLFHYLYQGGSKVERWEHWSDIDLGGFRIFHRLKTLLVPELVPYLMDSTTLQQMEAQCMHIKEKGYLDKLAKLLEDPEYSMFHDVISQMLEKKIRLEQEQLL